MFFATAPHGRCRNPRTCGRQAHSWGEECHDFAHRNAHRAALLNIFSWQTEPGGEWNIRLSVQGAGLVTNADESACQVSKSFPIQPGRRITVADGEGHELGVPRLADPLVSGMPLPTAVSPGDACQLTAILRDIPHEDGYLFRIAGDPSPRSTPTAENAAEDIAVIILFSTGDEIQVVENLNGTGDCTPDSQSAVYPGARLQWSPAFPTSDQRNASPWDGVFHSLLFSVPWVSVQHCTLSAGVHIPYAESLTFAIGDVALPQDE